MAQVSVTINGRKYQIACDDGQEAHLSRLANYVDQRVSELIAAVGQVGDARLLVMATLLVADELSDAYSQLEETNGVAPGTIPARGEGKSASKDAGKELAERKRIDDLFGANIEALAERVEGIAERLKQA
jgi:cell division protein ZapA